MKRFNLFLFFIAIINIHLFALPERGNDNYKTWLNNIIKSVTINKVKVGNIEYYSDSKYTAEAIIEVGEFACKFVSSHGNGYGSETVYWIEAGWGSILTPITKPDGDNNSKVSFAKSETITLESPKDLFKIVLCSRVSGQGAQGGGTSGRVVLQTLDFERKKVVTYPTFSAFINLGDYKLPILGGTIYINSDHTNPVICIDDLSAGGAVPLKGGILKISDSEQNISPITENYPLDLSRYSDSKETYNFSVEFSDFIGNSTVKSGTFIIDRTLPNKAHIDTIDGKNSNGAGTSSHSPFYIRIFNQFSTSSFNVSGKYDAHSGVKPNSEVFRFFDSEGNLIVDFFKNKDNYTNKTLSAQVQYQDNAGNYSEWSNPFYFHIDSVAPVCTQANPFDKIVFTKANSNNYFTGLQFSLGPQAPFSDTGSGLYSIQGTVSSGNNTWSHTILADQALNFNYNDTNSAIIPGGPRANDTTIKLQAFAYDRVGKKSTDISHDVILPRSATIVANITAHSSNVYNSPYEATITLKYSKEYSSLYNSFKITRKIFKGKDGIELGEGRQYITVEQTSIERDGSLDVVDIIPAEFGNCSVAYTLEQSLSYDPEIFEPADNSMARITLPNHPGKVTAFTLTDSAGHTLSVQEDGTISKEADFKPVNGVVRVTIKGTDVDSTSWAGLELGNYSLLGDTEFVLKRALHRLESITKLDGTFAVSFDTAIDYGTNYLQVSWNEEGRAGGKSPRITYQYNYQTGDFNLGSENTHTTKGFLLRPHEELSLALESASEQSTPAAIRWQVLQVEDNGADRWNIDAIVSSVPPEGASNTGMSYSQHLQQKPGDRQRADWCTYALEISITQNGSEQSEQKVMIPIVVEDTQWGILKGDEHWRGTHMVKGAVIVPSGVTLTIGADFLANGMDVLYQSSSSLNEKPCILVQPGGTLLVQGTRESTVRFAVEDTVIIPALLDVAGKASMDFAEVSGATRGIVIRGSGAKAHIENSIVRDNRDIGIHVTAGSELTMSSCAVFNNSTYGIKGEKGARMNITDSTLSGTQIWHIYDGSKGPLTTEELNAIPNNTGNVLEEE